MNQEHGNAAKARPGEDLPDRHQAQPHHLADPDHQRQRGHHRRDAEHGQRCDTHHAGDVGEQLRPARQGLRHARELGHQRFQNRHQGLAEGNAQRLHSGAELLPRVNHGPRHLVGALQPAHVAQLLHAVAQTPGVLGQCANHPRPFAAKSIGQGSACGSGGQVAQLALQLVQDVEHRQQLAVLVGELHAQFFRPCADVFKQRLVHAPGVAAFHGAAQRANHRELLGQIDTGRGGDRADFFKRILELGAVGAEQLHRQRGLPTHLLDPLAFAHGVGLILEQVVHGADVGAHGFGVGFGGLGQQVAGVGKGGQLAAAQALDRALDAVCRGHKVAGVFTVGHRKFQRLAVERSQGVLGHTQRADFAQGAVHLQRRFQ